MLKDAIAFMENSIATETLQVVKKIVDKILATADKFLRWIFSINANLKWFLCLENSKSVNMY